MHTQTTEPFQHVIDETSGGCNPWQYNEQLMKPTSDSE